MKHITLGLASGLQQWAAVGLPEIDDVQVLSVSDTTAQVLVTAGPVGATVHLYVSQSATPPAEADLVAGSGADWSGSFIVTGLPSGTPGPSGLMPATVYHLHVMAESTGRRSPIVSAQFETAAADVVAPVLSIGQVTALDETQVEVRVATDEAGGLLYMVVTTAQSVPSPAQIVAGQDSAGAAAAFANGGQAVSETGQQVLLATGLSETAHFAYLVHEDVSGNRSNIVEIGPFTPADVTAPVVSSVEIVANEPTLAIVTFNTDSGDGTAHVLVQPSADAPPTAAEVVSGASASQAITAGGVQSVEVTGLTAETAYLAYAVHVDAAGNQSPLVAALVDAITPPEPTDLVTSWTMNNAGTFTPDGGSFVAEKTESGGTAHFYSEAYLPVSVGDAVEITVTAGATTTVDVEVYIGVGPNKRSNGVSLSTAGGGTVTGQVTAQFDGTFSVVLAVVTIGLLDVESARATVIPQP